MCLECDYCKGKINDLCKDCIHFNPCPCGCGYGTCTCTASTKYQEFVDGMNPSQAYFEMERRSER